VLGHLECDEKSNEIPAVQTLLASLALTGSVVTVDAMHCQKKHYVDGSRLAMPLCYRKSILCVSPRLADVLARG
jgi:predicted transposase YbfD/YdcC